MKRELSAKLTILTKIILPGFWMLMMGIITLTLFFGVERSGQPSKFMFVGLWLTGAAFFYFTVMKFQKVSVDADFLYVSNFIKEIKIPLSEIYDVTEIVWLRGHPVTIHLKKPSEFGLKITFMPKSQGFKFFKPHPVVPELKEMAKAKSLVG